MEEIGKIEVSVKDRSNAVSPENIDIADVKDMISDIENILFPSKEDKRNRPKISYKIEKVL